MEDVIGSSRGAIGRRLVVIIDLLGRGDTHLSLILGYCNPSTIHKIRRGESLMGPEMLSKLAELEVETGQRPNLHWILTGEGEALCSPTASKTRLTLDALADSVALEFHVSQRESDASCHTRKLQSALRTVFSA